jgi:hypothetical protein
MDEAMRRFMKKAFLVSIILMSFAVCAYGQLYSEPPFGLDLPFYRWSRGIETYRMNIPLHERLFAPQDVAKLRFATESDTTDIVLVIDRGNARIYWLRCSADPSRRFLERRAYYSGLGSDGGQFINPHAIEVASASDYYDPVTDHIYVGDRMNSRLVKLNFEFDPNSPESDRFIWESSVSLDSNFLIVDMDYVNFGTGDANDNILLALDDYGSRLAVFSHEGVLSQIFDLRNCGDSTYGIYTGMAYRTIPDGRVAVYLADFGNSRICGYVYDQSVLTFVGDLGIEAGNQVQVTNVLYDHRIGLWAIESLGPHLFQLAPDLSSIIREIGPEYLDRVNIDYPIAVVGLPERLVILEEMDDDSGILTFAFDPPPGKRAGGSEEAIIPDQLSLSQNYPNPFNPATTIGFGLPVASPVRLEVFDILGRSVQTLVDGRLDAGFHEIVWDSRNRSGSEVATGIYFYRLRTSQGTIVKRMLLLK